MNIARSFSAVFHAKFWCFVPVTAPLSRLCGNGNVWRQSGEQVVGLVLQPLTAWCIAHQQCLPHAPVPCMSRNAQGSVAETACSKSALLEISLQSQALLHPRAGERQLHQGHSKSASWNTDKMRMTTAVGHVIVFYCSWLLGILDSMPETCMLH